MPVTRCITPGRYHAGIPWSVAPATNQAPLMVPALAPYTASNAADNPASASPSTMPPDSVAREPPPSTASATR
jgi:hypothetical protein